mgnify:CR=1 FL=1
MTKTSHSDPVTARSILSSAADMVTGDRQDDYGDARTSFTRIAALWSPILGVQVTPLQVALCMAGLKISRAVSSPEKMDTFIDLAGYAALAGEIVEAKNEPESAK